MNRNEKPLTLDEMRQMNGKPVQYEANGEIFIVDLYNPDFGECLVNEDGYYIPLHRAVDRSVGRRFFAYERPQIDREAWETCCVCSVRHRDWGEYQYAFCPYCGRPLTDSAWKQLEERLVQK